MSIRKPLERLCRSESGNMTILSIFFVIASLMAGSLAVDLGKKTMAEAELQVVADVTAHAAISTRLHLTEDAARNAALAIARRNTQGGRPTGVRADSITFGLWDDTTRSFTPEPGARQAVRVEARNDRAGGTMVDGVFSHVLGVAGFEIEAESIFIAETHRCALNGIVAEREIRISAANAFGDRFCLRSDRDIGMTIGNSFGRDGLVSLPNEDDLFTPAGRYGANPGLTEALSFEPGDRVDVPAVVTDFDTRFRAGDPDYLPSGVTFGWSDVTHVTGRLVIAPEELDAGGTQVFLCGGSGRLDFSDGTFRALALWTNCQITFSANTAFEDVTLVQDNTDRNAIMAPAGVRLGAADDCAPGGGVRLVTSGGMHVAANLQMHDATIVALGSVRFAANPQAMRGVAILSGDTVEVTSSGAFGTCDRTDRHVAWKTVRMVR